MSEVVVYHIDFTRRPTANKTVFNLETTEVENEKNLFSKQKILTAGNPLYTHCINPLVKVRWPNFDMLQEEYQNLRCFGGKEIKGAGVIGNYDEGQMVIVSSLKHCKGLIVASCPKKGKKKSFNNFIACHYSGIADLLNKTNVKELTDNIGGWGNDVECYAVAMVGPTSKLSKESQIKEYSKLAEELQLKKLVFFWQSVPDREKVKNGSNYGASIGFCHNGKVAVSNIHKEDFSNSKPHFWKE
jgi:hypothetical protein